MNTRRAWRMAGGILTGLVLALSDATAEKHTFTDTTGRTMVAEIMEVGETSVRVRRDDDRVFEIALTTLSEADRTYVAEWARTRAFAFGGVEVSARRVRLETDRTQTRSSTREVEQWCYKLTVANHSRLDLEGLVAEYRVFYVDDTATADRDERPVKRVRGRTAIGTLAAGKELELQTTSVALTVVQLKPGYRYSGTGKRRVEDSLSGIWVRIMRGSEVLHEFANPTTLPKTETW